MSSSLRHGIGWYTWTNQILLPLASGIYALKREDYEGFNWLCIATGVNQICIEILKTVIAEKRPNGGSRSFPSGDTAAAFLGPSFLIFRYGASNVPKPLLALSLVDAVGVAAGRVLIKAHWVHDVIGGAILGCMVTYYLCSTKPSSY